MVWTSQAGEASPAVIVAVIFLKDSSLGSSGRARLYSQTSIVWPWRFLIMALTAGLASPAWLVQNTKPYWFYFLDSKFAKWQEAGDWEAEMEQLLEHRLEAQAP